MLVVWESGIGARAEVPVTVTDGVGNSVVGKLQAKMESNNAMKAQTRGKRWLWKVFIFHQSFIDNNPDEHTSYHDQLTFRLNVTTM